MNRTCYHCKHPKPIEDFGKDKNKAFGRSYLCKSCKVLQQRIRDEAHKSVGRTIRQDNKRIGILKRSDYDAMYALQSGRCCICDQPKARLFIDHCHTSGEVRGLLCQFCNCGLGFFKDNCFSLQKAIVYLTERGKQT